MVEQGSARANTRDRHAEWQGAQQYQPAEYPGPREPGYPGHHGSSIQPPPSQSSGWGRYADAVKERLSADSGTGASTDFSSSNASNRCYFDTAMGEATQPTESAYQPTRAAYQTAGAADQVREAVRQIGRQPTEAALQPSYSGMPNYSKPSQDGLLQGKFGAGPYSRDRVGESKLTNFRDASIGGKPTLNHEGSRFEATYKASSNHGRPLTGFLETESFCQVFGITIIFTTTLFKNYSRLSHDLRAFLDFAVDYTRTAGDDSSRADGQSTIASGGFGPSRTGTQRRGGHKRQRREDDDDAAEKGDRAGGKRSIRKKGPALTQRPLACHFHLLDPRRFSLRNDLARRNFRTCSGPGWTELRRIA